VHKEGKIANWVLNGCRSATREHLHLFDPETKQSLDANQSGIAIQLTLAYIIEATTPHRLVRDSRCSQDTFLHLFTQAQYTSTTPKSQPRFSSNHDFPSISPSLESERTGQI
jgi:hypothetical protein